MSGILTEEKGHYYLDCAKAVWASDEIHELYHRCGLPHLLSDADFVAETESSILLIEYKNANVTEAIIHRDRTASFDPFQKDKFDKIVKKFYDSLHYLHLMGKTKPVHYIYVLEYPKGDTVTRKLLRNKLKDRLPFRMQSALATGIKLIESFHVLSISEWNSHEIFGRYPLLPCSQTRKS